MLVNLIGILILILILIIGTILTEVIIRSGYKKRGLKRSILHPQRIVRFIFTWIAVFMSLLTAGVVFRSCVPSKTDYEECRERSYSGPRWNRPSCSGLSGEPKKKW